MKVLDKRDDLLRLGSEHFWFKLGGKQHGYCYIRKNGCTTFKRFLCGISEYKDRRSGRQSDLSFLNQYHRISSYEELKKCTQVIFVYRDPWERAVSTFVHKFIIRRGSGDIFDNYREELKEDPASATFRGFAEKYCCSFSRRDPHIRPQSAHLLPIFYSAAIPIRDLSREMGVIAGQKLAREYFSEALNRTEKSTCSVKPGKLADVPCSELHSRFMESQEVPSKEAFEDASIRAVVRKRYDRDFQMIRRLKGG